MDYEKIKFATLEAYKQLDIKSFPVDCIDALHKLGMKVQTYSEQKPKKKEKCFEYSEDAFTLKKIVYYNELMPQTRINFTLAHEIAHIVLKHSSPRTDEHEREADCFASYFLAPRMAIHYSKCKNHVHVSNLFNISYEAAQYAFNDYRRWHRRTIYHKMTPFDKTIYSYFYDKGQDKFIYNLKECIYCKRKIYNTQSAICGPCNVLYRYRYTPQQDMDFLIAESNWLYGGL